jgi:hypothetical protein
VSSTNYWCVKVGQFLKGLIPIISLVVVALLMLRLRPSLIIMKRKGDSGYPCLMPLVGHKGLVGAPFISSE